MDYPKSVPGVGLVNNRFVDEDPVNGTPGSLIPAAWGNAVTDELLGVLEEAGEVPVEGNSGQVRASILIIALNVVRSMAAKATEAMRGAVRIGTQSEVDAGVLDDVAVTPKKLRMGFSSSLTPNGYVVLPSWMGGVIFQWGSSAVSSGGTVTFPLTFPGFVRVTTSVGMGTGLISIAHSIEGTSPWTGFKINHTAQSAVPFHWIAVGV